MTLAHESREPEHGRVRDVMAITNVNKGTGELICNEDDSPSLKGVSHDSKATSTIGQGSKHPSNTFEQHERSVPTSVSPTQGTQLTSQPLWTLWILPTQWSHLPLIQVIKWHLSGRNTCTRNT